MSIVHLNHITGELEKRIIPVLDKSDLERLPDADQKNNLLSRAYSVYTLKCLTNQNYDVLSCSITDGFGDNGVDAIYWDIKNNIFYIVQSKWIKSGSGGPEKGEILKFLEGVKKLLTFHFEDFNDKVLAKKEEVKKAFYNSDVKVKIIVCHTGNNLSPDCKKTILNCVQELNDADEVVFFEEFNLKDAHRSLTLGVEGSPINIEVDLLQWGKNDEPVKSVYGQVNCLFFAQIFKNHKLRLFSQNIRGFMGESDINMQIVKSVIKEPENFVYLNNGITILTKRLTKSVFGGNDRASGHFTCEDLTIVNGAQTVGSLYEAYKKNPEQLSKAYVFTRIISLENCPQDFERLVTVATNTQNKIEKKDFVSLDPEQHRLKTELLLEDIFYTYKRDGNPIVKDDKHLDLEEATIALACLYPDVDFSTNAKREISKLWEDTKKAPYKLLFNERLTSQKLYKSVMILRKIEQSLREEMWGNDELNSLILIHGYYLISHLIFQEIDKDLLNNSKRELGKDDWVIINKKIIELKTKVLDGYLRIFLRRFPPSVFKNAQYVRSLKEYIYNKEGKVIPGQTLDIFDN